MFGIDDLACYIPYFYLDVKDLSEQREISYEKLNKGLGLSKMALPNSNEDAATMAANAALELIERNNLDPDSIGRLYVGTESAKDGSKPIASYVLGMLDQHCGPSQSFRHTDAVDFTFACIGGVDALLNTLDFVRLNPDKMGIVICTDIAKYELESTGEYTQGAGAVAILVRQNPRLLAIEGSVGVACKCEHDFFKPLRRVDRPDMINGRPDHYDLPTGQIHIHKETPVFDGQFSNQCYADRLKEAYEHFKGQSGGKGFRDWHRMIFHLPYAFHAKRIFTAIYYEEMQDSKTTQGESDVVDLKEIGRSADYRDFVSEMIERGQRASTQTGNLYTASIFMALMSSFESDMAEDNELSEERIGFCAYGSGSKSKVFEAVVQSRWREVVQQWDLFGYLMRRKSVNFSEYESIHRGSVDLPLPENEPKFSLESISDAPLYGVRSYVRR